MVSRSGDIRPDRSPATRYAVALIAVAAASALQYSLQPLVGERFPLATFPIAVVVAAWFGGFGPALLATVGGSLASVAKAEAAVGAAAASRPPICSCLQSTRFGSSAAAMSPH